MRSGHGPPPTYTCNSVALPRACGCAGCKAAFERRGILHRDRPTREPRPYTTGIARRLARGRPHAGRGMHGWVVVRVMGARMGRVGREWNTCWRGMAPAPIRSQPDLHRVSQRPRTGSLGCASRSRISDAPAARRRTARTQDRLMSCRARDPRALGSNAGRWRHQIPPGSIDPLGGGIRFPAGMSCERVSHYYFT